MFNNNHCVVASLLLKGSFLLRPSHDDGCETSSHITSQHATLTCSLFLFFKKIFMNYGQPFFSFLFLQFFLPKSFFSSKIFFFFFLLDFFFKCHFSSSSNLFFVFFFIFFFLLMFFLYFSSSSLWLHILCSHVGIAWVAKKPNSIWCWHLTTHLRN